jgi:hypothetical protein
MAVMSGASTVAGVWSVLPVRPCVLRRVDIGSACVCYCRSLALAWTRSSRLCEFGW